MANFRLAQFSIWHFNLQSWGYLEYEIVYLKPPMVHSVLSPAAVTAFLIAKVVPKKSNQSQNHGQYILSELWRNVRAKMNQISTNWFFTRKHFWNYCM